MTDFYIGLCGGMSGPTPLETFDADMKAFVASLPKEATLLFGGVTAGLVGRVASAASQRGLRLEGALIAEEKSDRHPALSRAQDFEDYDERQTYLYETSSVLFFLPGGLGTLHELFDFLLRNKLRQRQDRLASKRIVLVNGLKFWSPVQQLLRTAVEKGFLSQEDLSSLETWEPPAP